MKYVNPGSSTSIITKYLVTTLIIGLSGVAVYYFSAFSFSSDEPASKTNSLSAQPAVPITPKVENINTSGFDLYNQKMNHIINGDSSGRWVTGESMPLDGAILPYKRIIAFYGNLYSKQMGILGELPSL